MSRYPTITDIKKSACGSLNTHVINKKVDKKKLKKISIEKVWIGLTLIEYCAKRGLKLETEFKFSETRKFRFDWAIPELKLAVEYNGIFSEKSRHTTITGYTGDMEKINAAQQLGWKVFQYTALNYRELAADLEKLSKDLP